MTIFTLNFNPNSPSFIRYMSLYDNWLPVFPFFPKNPKCEIKETQTTEKTLLKELTGFEEVKQIEFLEIFYDWILLHQDTNIFLRISYLSLEGGNISVHSTSNCFDMYIGEYTFRFTHSKVYIFHK